MFVCPVCGHENFQEDARQGYCHQCHAFTRACSIGACRERPAVVAGNVALCRPHADEIGLALPTVTSPEAAIAAAWNAWLESDDHRLSCVGYSEGQGCCADADGDGAEGQQHKLIALALSALEREGYLVHEEREPESGSRS